MVIVVRDPQIETRFNGMKQFTVYVVETKVHVVYVIIAWHNAVAFVGTWSSGEQKI